MKTFGALMVIVLTCCLFFACSRQATEAPYQPAAGDLGKVSLLFAAPPPGITEVVATVSRNGYTTHTLQLTISDSTSSAAGSIGDLAPGTWHLRVQAFDSLEVVQFSGETDVEVRSGQTANVNLQLLPTGGGGIDITVTWGTPGPNLIANGSFEQGPWLGTYLPLDSGSTAIDHWVVTRQEIDLVIYWQAYRGDRSIDLNGSPGRGGIAQTFPTTAGMTYRVSFALAGNPESPEPIRHLGVSAAGSSTQYTFDITGKTIDHMGWQLKSWTFVATGPMTTLEFYSLDSPSSWFGPAIDDVSVVAVN